MAEENKVDLLMSVDIDVVQALKDLAEVRVATEEYVKSKRTSTSPPPTGGSSMSGWER